MSKYVLLLGWLLASGLAAAQPTPVPSGVAELAWRTRAHWAPPGLTADNLLVTSSHTEPGGLTYLYVQQLHAGIPVHNRVVTLVVAADGQLRHHAGAFVPERQFAGLQATPTLPAATALTQALTPLAPALATARVGRPQPQLLTTTPGFAQRQAWAAPALARRQVITSLVWVANGPQPPRLAWNVSADLLETADWRNVRVDAATGLPLEQDSWTVHEAPVGAALHAAQPLGPVALPSQRQVAALALGPAARRQPIRPAAPHATTAAEASYLVVPFPRTDPAAASLQLETSPWLRAGTSNEAGTYGWQYDGNSTYAETRGNNVWAYDDSLQRDAPGRFAAATSTSNGLQFQYQPDFNRAPTLGRNRRAATVNAFYWANLLHDIFYQYGFTEKAGNFQTSNLGRGGKGTDHVQVEVQDGSGVNNAKFTTAPDGTVGRMQLFLWSPPTAPVLAVTAPAAIAGPLVSAEGTLGPNNLLINTGAVSGPLALYPDADNPAAPLACIPTATGSLAGRVALLYRGSCDFASKVYYAQLAGAVAVVVVNVDNSLLTMTGSDPRLTIPAVMVSQADGQRLATQLAQGQAVRVTLQPPLPQRDGAFDNSVIAHEYGHGVSSRLTGGAASASCLTNAEQGGEGWSDYFSLLLTTDWATTKVNDGARPRLMSAYAAATSPTGLRRYPYSTDMAISPLTYDDVQKNPEVHAIGEVWCAALWDMTWNIIGQQSQVEPNVYNSASTGGNVIALQLVMQGLKLQPCGPGFLDARDAILAADSLLYQGRYHCAIWQAFARRGMGLSARQGSSYSTGDQVAAFDQPGVQLRKAVAPLTGEVLDITLGVSNTCGLTQTLASQALTLTSQLPPGVAYVSSSGGTLAGRTVTFGNVLAPGQPHTLSLRVRAQPGQGCAAKVLLRDDRENSVLNSLQPQYVSAWGAAWEPTTARAANGSSSWHIGIPAGTTVDAALVSEALPLGSAAVLSFQQYFSTEFGYGGGLVELSINDGATWQDAAPYFLLGGYNSTFQTWSAAGQPCFTGSSSSLSGPAAFSPVLLNLSSFAGQTVRFRFRLRADQLGEAEGWYVDNVQVLSGCGGTQQVQLLDASGTVLDSYAQPLFTLPAPLPVELVSFTATTLGPAAVRLAWATASELNSDYFDVERSLDGLAFEPVGRVAAAGNSATTRQYEWRDNAPPANASPLYYRLRQADHDGTAHYSAVRTVALGAAAGLSLAPNPAHSATVLRGAAPGAAVQVLDALGRQVGTATADARGTAQLIMPSGLAAGIYVVRAGSQQVRLAVE